jgi:putative protease
MYGGRAGRDYVTRTHPDNRGIDLGTVVSSDGQELVIEVSQPVAVGDGLGFEAPGSRGGPTAGFTVDAIRSLPQRGPLRQAITTRTRITPGWRVIRTAHAALLERARESFADTELASRPKTRLDIRVFGAAGAPLKAVFTSGDATTTVQSAITLAPASKRGLTATTLREQLGRLGDTPFTLGAIDDSALAPALFLPVSELNRLRQAATTQLGLSRDWALEGSKAARRMAIDDALTDVTTGYADNARGPELSAQVYTVDDANAAADAGATEICFDPFLRHPAPPLSRVRALADSLSARGIAFRLRTPSIMRPEDRRLARKWLDAGFAFHSGHLGLVDELAAAGHDVAADYAVNVFNQHTAAEIFALGARRITLSVELTAQEMADVVAPWRGAGFAALVYGRPEGMTLEHCVLSAAFDREVTTCRDLCVDKHANVTLTDPTGYTFPVATDYACRNRLLHSRPVDGSEFLPALWRSGIRSFQLVFNVPGDPVAEIVGAFRKSIDALAGGALPDEGDVRNAVGRSFTRGHFARAV